MEVIGPGAVPTNIPICTHILLLMNILCICTITPHNIYLSAQAIPIGEHGLSLRFQNI